MGVFPEDYLVEGSIGRLRGNASLDFARRSRDLLDCEKHIVIFIVCVADRNEGGFASAARRNSPRIE
jgi:hypothetical protein